MGCSNSKDNHQSEADGFAERKKNNFKDPALEKHRQDCIQQKKKLHHVEDPEVARKKQAANIQKKQKKEAKGPVGLTENELQAKRNNLKHRT
jgi:ribosomal protein S21